MHHQKTCIKDKFGYEIAIRYGIDAICGNLWKFQQFGYIPPVNRQPGACQGSGTQRHDIDPVAAFLQSLLIPV